MEVKTDSRSEEIAFPPDTKCIPDEQYVNLEVVDLSIFRDDGPGHTGPSLSEEDSRVQKDLITRALNAFRTTGFIAVKGHGLTTEDIHRQFSLGRLLNEDVSEEEKRQLHAQIASEGSWAGYKVYLSFTAHLIISESSAQPQGYYHRPDGAFDYLEHYDFYPFTAIDSRLPNAAKPYLDEFRQFIEYNHYVLLWKILAIISLGLGLKRDFLWNLHHRGDTNDGALRGGKDAVKWRHSKDHLRYAMYHPPSEEDRERKNHLWLPGHTDIGSVTFLYSQPVAGLQLLTPDGQWKYIRHYPNHIIMQLGDSMEFLTGILKASPHRVIEPPEDQRHLKRLGIFFFVPFLPEVKLSLIDHPSLRTLGAKDAFEEYYQLGGKPITSAEWLVMKSKLVGTKRVKREKRGPIDVLEDIHFRYNP
ncbi:hypothetical protein VKT23_001285 [Stygiomarasmius scandens]|uniref:Isopenicillin N synthase-like Fe(2+) 2OG dioxygenase domain-containing protein n=1 Tax=Marasmiellus scandens TaxID=2682957 RepID=A0ABR1K6M7_9AGAR